MGDRTPSGRSIRQLFNGVLPFTCSSKMNASPSDTHAQLGSIVRQLHDALSSLGYDATIRKIAGEIPDARDRLAYVGGMTEAAASKVLNLVDASSPACEQLSAHSSEIQDRLGQALAAAPDAATAPLMKDCLDYARHVGSHSETLRSTLTDIMMAQDFQDLSGQVIGKVIDIITRTEMQLVELLLHSGGELSHCDSAELAGPQVPDKAMQQDDVDDLLASMGF